MTKFTPILRMIPIVVLTNACGLAPDPSSDPSVKATAAAAAELTTPSPVAPSGMRLRGYRHMAPCSRMKIGDGVRQDQIFEFERIVGSEGVLAYGKHGVTLGVPNAGAPSTRAERFPGTADDHTARVLRYFVEECGLPSDQVGETHITALMRSEGSVLDKAAGKQETPVLVGYTTVIDRAVAGVSVRGSYAWARFNKNDEVVAEEVYWPEIPDTLLDSASSAQRALQAQPARAQLAQRLPPALQNAPFEVVIHHSPHFQDTFEAVVAVEAPGSASAQRFNLDGTEFRFAHEKAADLEAMNAPSVRPQSKCCSKP